FALCRHLSQNVNGLGLQPIQMCTRRNITHVYILFKSFLSLHAGRTLWLSSAPTTNAQPGDLRRDGQLGYRARNLWMDNPDRAGGYREYPGHAQLPKSAPASN